MTSTWQASKPTAPESFSPLIREKKRLRRHYRQQRQALDPATQAARRNSIARHFFCSPLPLRAGAVAGYVATSGELDPAAILTRLSAMGHAVGLPVIRTTRPPVMDFYELDPQRGWVENRFGISEPGLGARYLPTLRLALVLMPLVAFDLRGHRLGMGGGFYDRHFGNLPPALRPLLVGVAHSEQLHSGPLPAESWDLQLDAVLTERGLTAFTRRFAQTWRLTRHA